MAYTPANQLPLLEIFQWSTPTFPNPKLLQPLDAADTDIFWSSKPLDKDGNIVTGNFLMNAKNRQGYTEQIYVPSGILSYDAQTANFTLGDVVTGGTSGATAYIVADTDNGTTGILVLSIISGTFQTNETITDASGGSATSDGTLTNGVASDGLSASNIVRGVRLEGLDFFTGDTDLAVDLEQDSPIGNVISPVTFQLMMGAMQGLVASGGETWIIGKNEDNDIIIYAGNGDANRPYWLYKAASNGWFFSNDGINETAFGTGAGVTAGDGIATIVAGLIKIDLASSNPGLEFSSAKLQIKHTDFQNQVNTYQGSDTGAADAYAIVLNVPITAYVEGLKISFTAANTSTGASTINVDGLGTKTILHKHDVAIAAGDIESGQIVELTYDGTAFQMTSPSALAAATEAFVTANTNIKVGEDTFSPSSTSSTKVIAHGLGRTPKLVTIDWGSSTAVNSFNSLGEGRVLYDGTSQRAISRKTSSAGNADWLVGFNVNNDNDSTIDWTGAVTFDGTNITISVPAFNATSPIVFTWKAE